MTRPVLDARISLGNILTGLIMVGGFFAQWSAVVASEARQEERVASISERIVDLRDRLARFDVDHDKLLELEAALRQPPKGKTP